MARLSGRPSLRYLRRPSMLGGAAVLVAIAGYFPPVVAGQPQGADVNSLGLTATYEVEATFGWHDQRVSVTTTAAVTNNVRWSVSTLAFNLATLRVGRAQVGEVTVDGGPVAATVADQTILVPLGRDLPPSDEVQVVIEYTARLNSRSDPNADDWGFARIGDVLTAYRWIPWLSRTTPFDRPSVGEPYVTASSPQVNVTITTNEPVLMASSGSPVDGGLVLGTTHEFTATNVRDFNIAASPSYQTRSAEAGGTTITFFYRTLPAATVLDVAARAVSDYSEKVGPFPHHGLSIAEIGPWAPFESPAHFWLPSNASNRLLPWMTAHETAHMWFYSAVGSDQAREPFADEAIADFMARDLLNRFVPSQCARGTLDQTIYDLGECYGWVIYVQGVEYLRAHRDRIGARSFWSAVSSYYEANRYGMGGTRALLDTLHESAGGATVDVERFPRLYPPICICLPFRTP